MISGWAQSIPFYVSLLERANAAGCLTVLDCTGEALWQCLKCRPFLIKPNLSELGALFGVDDLDYLEGVELAAQVQREGARNVLVSMGPGGAFLLTEDQRLYLAPACGGTGPQHRGGGGRSGGGVPHRPAADGGFCSGPSAGGSRGLRRRLQRLAARWGGDPGYGGQDPGGVGPLLTEFEQKSGDPAGTGGISASY